MENKLTDNEIIKALECCSESNSNAEYCEDCPFKDTIGAYCMDLNIKAALDLINRQKAELERLQKENKSIRYCYEQAKSYNDTLAKSCEKNCKNSI